MKTKISISLEEELDKRLEEKVQDSIFRSKSHLIEYAVKSFLKNKNEKVEARRQ